MFMVTGTYVHGHWYLYSWSLVNMLMVTGTYAHGHWYLCSWSLVNMLMVTDTYAHGHWYLCSWSLVLMIMVTGYGDISTQCSSLMKTHLDFVQDMTRRYNLSN